MDTTKAVKLLATKWLNEANSHGVDAHVYRDLSYQVMRIIAEAEEKERIEQMYHNDVDHSRHSPW